MRYIYIYIYRCDSLAKAIINASKECSEQEICKPIILRMKGTNVEEAREIIRRNEDKLNIHFEETMDNAAQLAVELATKPYEAGI